LADPHLDVDNVALQRNKVDLDAETEGIRSADRATFYLTSD
jgi:hypothetical protein